MSSSARQASRRAERDDAEAVRLAREARREANSKRRGPYLSERQRGTVREDDSADGAAWSYSPHEHATTRPFVERQDRAPRRGRAFGAIPSISRPMSRAAVIVLVAAATLVGCEEDDDQASPVVTASSTAAPTPTNKPPEPPPPPPAEREDLPDPDRVAETLEEQRDAMIARMKVMGVLSPSQEPALREIIEGSKILGQGNPAAVDHPMTRRECMARRAAAGVHEEPKAICGAPFMAPVYDPSSQQESDAKLCIDRYEFPGLPCDYPVTWVTTGQARRLCEVLGKRLCDAHEWEGACAGKLRAPEDDYAFRGPRDTQSGLHNLNREIVWAYGPKKDHGKCATQSHRSRKCATSSWGGCGSNTYPAGAFPECRSPFGVYDLHGNAAEHMLLPLRPSDLGAEGGAGVAEMKGSWFIFDHYEAHKDDCRWRAPSWHDDEGMGHANYHLGFRCCKDL